ncbi:MAG TPA: GNAT family N-acetyltransferase, partial [Thermoanaerobaculia bacterium]|nr:GNAT family N-acetyltransferase [Thermoanaerobaculia bacterium]
HADRFDDASLLVFDDDTLVALLPANVRARTYISHGGLTYGGFIVDARMRAVTMLGVFEATLRHLAGRGIDEWIYKPLPHIYHSMPSEEDLYALFRVGAQLVRRDVATTIARGAAAPYTKGRKYCLNKGKKSAALFARSYDFEAFMRVEEQNLLERHNTAPVHSAAELMMLAERFPDNIKLFVAAAGGELAAGVVVYETAQVAHAQYIASTPAGREICALDVLVDHVVRDVYRDKPFFDFGISTEQQGRYLNVGLNQNKESHGGRATVYDWYRIDLLRGDVLTGLRNERT